MLVRSVWLILILVDLFCVAQYGQNVPFNEDWDLVPPLTGNEPNLASWLWSQNSEHRVPLPRLILLVLLKLTSGDFRAGMFFNVVTLGILAFCMIQVARRLRGGRTIFADAFFAIALLHLGNRENLMWGWQLSFVVPTAMTCALFLVMVSCPTFSTPRTAIFGGACLVLLPLCGANGLLVVPFFALWLIYSGVINWYQAERWIGALLIVSGMIAVILTALYFVGYERSTWYPTVGLRGTLETTGKFLALGFGPGVAKSWKLSIMITIGFLLVSALAAMLAVMRHKGWERQRALGILLFAGNLVVFALALGWGRAGYYQLAQHKGLLPERYVLFAVPILVVCFFVWELYGSKKIGNIAQIALLLGTIVLLPFNTKAGLDSGRWYLREMNSVQNDLLAGLPRSMLVQRHGAFLLHWDENKLSAGMQMLHNAGIGPFAKMREDPVEPINSLKNP